jgi:hypothetical protein
MINKTLPAYLYQQYSSDDTTPYLQAFFDAYNSVSQSNLDRLNNLNLPIYTNPMIVGNLLNWVAEGIYGLKRPSLSTGSSFSPLGVYNTVPLNTTAYSQNIAGSPGISYQVDDDYYKRILTWNFYKGDGFQPTTTWLKRRVYRFLNGVNGVAPTIPDTYSISVVFYNSNIIIHVPNSTAAQILDAAMQDGVLNVPFEYNYTVTY